MTKNPSLQFLNLLGFSNPAVRTLLTTRFIGPSSDLTTDPKHSAQPPFNLATHVGDDPNLVASNRALLRQHLPQEPLWLNQIHGVAVADDSTATVNALGASQIPTADAAVTLKHQRVLAVLTADCLPVVFASVPNTQTPYETQLHGVAAAHAGWRGLVNGVLENTVARLRLQLAPGTPIEASFGAAIGPLAFEVGVEVFHAFCEQAKDAEQLQIIKAAFKPLQAPSKQSPSKRAQAPEKWLANLYQLAQIRLEQIGVKVLVHPGWCTYRDEQRFFSHRRDTVRQREGCLPDGFVNGAAADPEAKFSGLSSFQPGRQATLVWLDR
jgi:polyphenol oxidase